MVLVRSWLFYYRLLRKTGYDRYGAAVGAWRLAR